MCVRMVMKEIWFITRYINQKTSLGDNWISPTKREGRKWYEMSLLSFIQYYDTTGGNRLEWWISIKPADGKEKKVLILIAANLNAMISTVKFKYSKGKGVKALGIQWIFIDDCVYAFVCIRLRERKRERNKSCCWCRQFRIDFFFCCVLTDSLQLSNSNKTIYIDSTKRWSKHA